MSGLLNADEIVAVVRYKDNIRWFQSDRDIWVLDWKKWRADFSNAGFDVPPLNGSERFGITVVDEYSVDKFLDSMKEFETSKDELRSQLLLRYADATSWWDVSDLFPILFVNFDNKKLGAFYPEGTRMERYAPDGWNSEFVDFASTYSEEVFPENEKFWMDKGIDMLKVLNKRGENLRKR